MHANKLVVYFVCRWKALVNLPPSERWGKTFGLPATETYFSVACERICKSNGAELGGPTLRLMLIMPRHRLAYCEVMPAWLSQGKAVVVLWRYGQPQHVRVMDAYCCAATQSRWLGSRWSHFNCVWSYCWHKMKAVTVNVQKKPGNQRHHSCLGRNCADVSFIISCGQFAHNSYSRYKNTLYHCELE